VGVHPPVAGVEVPAGRLVAPGGSLAA
jgi:hypothetical protein